jgi:hypothetical protein
MAFIKPSLSKVRDYAATGQMNGMIYNPPRYEEMGGLKSARKTEKNKMAVSDRGNGKHGPFTKSSGGS